MGSPQPTAESPDHLGGIPARHVRAMRGTYFPHSLAQRRTRNPLQFDKSVKTGGELGTEEIEQGAISVRASADTKH
jgi:hypothetical protein